MATLIITSGTGDGNFYPLGHRTNVIGRDEGLPIQLTEEHVSRKHLRVHYEKEGNHYTAEDLKSKHGVFINGARIQAKTALADGDVIDVGGVTMLFTTQDFEDKAGALAYRKKAGERYKGTLME